MKTIVFLAVISGLSCGIARAQTDAPVVTASRALKLCWIEDPLCLPTLKAAYDSAVSDPRKFDRENPARAKANGAITICPDRYEPLSDGKIVGYFMQTANMFRDFLGFPVDYFEARFVLTAAFSCWQSGVWRPE